MKRMLINATHTDEIRVAIADGQKLCDLDIDSAGHYRKKGNIYKAKITRVEPSLEACFVNYGSERHGFLPYKEISPVYCKQAPRGKARLPINEALREGDEIIVQVNKEERGNKGAALSTYISLAGRYLVYMPGNHRAGGISRQIHGEKRIHLQDIMRRLDIPKNDGVIIRTAGLGRTFEELQWDFNYLKQVWEAIGTAAKQKRGPFFIYQESDLFIRALRDYLQPDIGEILIDDRESYEKAREFMQQVMPHNLKKLSYYNDNTPLFSRYQIERQIQSAFEREVKLPSGGALVIDQTEALLSIDINSAKATKGIDVETTALNTNLEAADEIARQLKIRDLGGLVVIDFIDMRNSKNQREVENRMRDAAETDRARVQIGKISKFGLLEMSRQRLRSSISDSSQITCPTCGGHGYIRSMDSLVISIIRLTEEEMIKPKTGRVVIQAPVDTTNKILNDKRTELSEMESRHGVQVSVISNDNLSFPDFHVQRLNSNESRISVDAIELVKPEDCHKAISLDPPASTVETPALRMVKPDTQAPKRTIGMAVTNWLKGIFAKPTKQTAKKQTRKKPYNKRNNNQAAKGQHKQGQKPNQQRGQQRGQQKGQQKGQKQQQPQKQHNKQAPKGNQQQNQKTAKPNQQKQAKQQPKQQGKQRQSNQNKENNSGQNSNNNQNKPNNKGGKSIYGNKNQNRKQTNKPTNTEAETDPNAVNKMTRPLGSVAELAVKKEAIVPSGAMKNRPIDNIDIDSKLNQTKADQQPQVQKPQAQKQAVKGPVNDKPSEVTSATKVKSANKADNQSQSQPAKENIGNQKPSENTAAKKVAPNKATQPKATQTEATATQTGNQKPAEDKATPQSKAPKKAATKKKTTAKAKTSESGATETKATQENLFKEDVIAEKRPVKKAPAKKAAAKKPAVKPAAPKPVDATTSEQPKQPKPADKVAAADKVATTDKVAAADSSAAKPKSESSVTAQMIKPGLYKAKKSD
ncbi:Ribonuclease E [hydrothermal vent metagenome]|uniref:Ribonuclease G n=1 Tax=hydrothermal vent metagenome TaxID=652676 RepID=A0A3B0VK40_9ZZZZ